MKKLNKSILFVALLASTLTMSSCSWSYKKTVTNGTGTTEVNGKSISISGGDEGVEAGSTFHLSITYTGCSGDVTWTSSNTNIATVDNYGNVTIASQIATTSTVTITATLNSDTSITAFKTFTLNPKVVKENATIAINGEDSVTVGSTLTLSATLSNCFGTVNWTSSNTNVATISSTGVVTPSSSVTTETQVTITATLDGNSSVTTTKVITVKPKEVTALNTMTINSDNFSISSDYSTGSWSYFSSATSTTNYVEIDGVTFNYYRGTNTSTSTDSSGNKSFIKLLTSTSILNSTYGYEDAALYNIDAIGGIDYINITYKKDASNSDTTKVEPTINFGSTNACDNKAVTINSSSWTTAKIDVSSNNYQYFKVDSGSYNMYISSIVIGYGNDTKIARVDNADSGTGLYRLNPTRYTGTLTPGETSVTVPLATTVNNDGTYTVTKTKKLTYYTYDYVAANTSCASDAALTDPIEICAYYNAFSTWPANYVASGDYTTAYAIFGSSTRQYSSYNKTTGYATAVPYNCATGKSYPQYYELDIDLAGNYATSTKANRGVGRIVAWHYGFSTSGYDSNPVCVFTDDHYVTFREYLNNGTFSKRFNATGYSTASKYGSATTLTNGSSNSGNQEEQATASITISGDNSIKANSTSQYTATLSNCSGDVTWTSSNTSVATVDSTGLVTTCASLDTNTTITLTATLSSDTTVKATKTITIINNKTTEDSANLFAKYDFSSMTGTNQIGEIDSYLTVSTSYTDGTCVSSSLSNLYAGTGCLRFSTSSKAGSVVITTSSDITKVVITGKNFKSGESSSLSVNSSEVQSFTSESTENELTFEITSSNTITITGASGKRSYVSSIALYC